METPPWVIGGSGHSVATGDPHSGDYRLFLHKTSASGPDCSITTDGWSLDGARVDLWIRNVSLTAAYPDSHAAVIILDDEGGWIAGVYQYQGLTLGASWMDGPPDFSYADTFTVQNVATWTKLSVVYSSGTTSSTLQVFDEAGALVVMISAPEDKGHFAGIMLKAGATGAGPAEASAYIDDVKISVPGPSGSIVGWGDCSSGNCDVPEPNADFVDVAGGYVHSCGLKADGSVLCWGLNPDGQCDVPSEATDCVAISAGWWHNICLKSDGSTVLWGCENPVNDNGQCALPVPNEGFVQVSAGYWHNLGLKEDGSIVGWGANE